MNASTYPRDFKHKSDGKQCRGRYRMFRKPLVQEYGTDRMVEKLLVELDQVGPLEETVTYWLGDNGTLLSQFQAEIGRRLKLGKSDLEPGEWITITQSGEQRPSRTTGNPMWDYGVEFEFAAPPPTAAELVLGQADTGSGNIEIPTVEAEEDASIPF